MKIGIITETRDQETRVAASPESVGKFTALGAQVALQSGAGAAAMFTDAAYAQAGASISADPQEILSASDLLLKARAPTPPELSAMKPGALLAGMLAPHAPDTPAPADYAAASVTAFALERIPRITRAQSMDVLSSQANLAGYKAVLEAAALAPRMFPMMMTAAGAIAPARVFVMGVGVAGLQAIATAKRLGAIVSATDVRPATQEQVESLGATFLAVDADAGEAETAGGYARETSAAYKQAQQEAVRAHIPKQDIVITTALIPGRPAPRLISADMTESMRPGSLIADLAAEQGGNCELTRPDQIHTTENGVTLIGWRNMAARLPADASALYARNLFAFAALLIDTSDKDNPRLHAAHEDEILQAALLSPTQPSE